MATGRILLPYAEIDEPFTAYYDAEVNKSRIDYYGDLMQTVQRPDINQFYKLAYMVNGNGDAVRVCFNMAGTFFPSDCLSVLTTYFLQTLGTTLSPVSVQGVLPDLSNFQLKVKGVCRKMVTKVQTEGDCEAWEYRVTVGQKDNKYMFILRRDAEKNAIPIYYLMFGYDSLLGSHYDKYEVCLG